MRIILMVLFSVALLTPVTIKAAVPAQPVQDFALYQSTSEQGKRPEWFKRAKMLKKAFALRRRSNERDRYAIWSAWSMGMYFGIPLIVSLIVGDFLAGAVIAIYLSPVFLAAVVFAVIALARIPNYGWRRGTFWAIVTLGAPLVLLLISWFLGTFQD